MNTGFEQQQPLAFSAAVRTTRSPQHAAHLHLDSARPAPEPPIRSEEKFIDPSPKR
jgi:hypothetical protein